MAREPYSIESCIHYRDTTTVCRSSIDPRTVTDADGRLPCVVIRGITGTLPCTGLQMPVRPVVGESGRMGAMLSKLLEGVCPSCDEAMRGELELDGQMIAMPCRHVIRSVKQ